jgi:hypothetical protein
MSSISSTISLLLEEQLLVVENVLATIAVLLGLDPVATLELQPALVQQLHVPTRQVGAQGMRLTLTHPARVGIDCRIA